MTNNSNKVSRPNTELVASATPIQERHIKAWKRRRAVPAEGARTRRPVRCIPNTPMPVAIDRYMDRLMEEKRALLDRIAEIDHITNSLIGSLKGIKDMSNR